MKKICDFVKNVVITVYILMIIFVTICLLSYNDYKVTVFGNTTLVPIIDKDLEPDYTVGDLVIINKNDFSEISLGDTVFFFRTIGGETTINYAAVTGIEPVTEKEVTITVEGGYKFSSSYFIGKSETATVIPILGRILSILESKWGFLFLGVFPSLIAFLYTIYSIIIEFSGVEDVEEKTKKKTTTKEIEKNSKNKKAKENNDSKKEEKKTDDKKIENLVKEKEIEEKQEEIKEKPKDEIKEEKIEVVEESKKEKNTEVIEESKKEEKTETVEESKKEEKSETVEETKKEEKSEVIKEIENEKIEKKDTKKLTDEEKKALIEEKMKSMTPEEKKALLEAKLKSMTPEEKRALIEAKKKKIEAEKNKK